MPKEENAISNVEPEDEKISVPKKEKKPEKKSSGNGFVLFLLLLVVGASGGASYYFWEQLQKQTDELQQQQQSILNLQKQLKKTVADFSDNIAISTKNTTQLENLSEQIRQTETISQQAIEVVNRNQRDWALAEIDYLLRIAHQRIAVASDIAGAIAALKGADARIEQLGDLSLFKIRKQLAKDIANLNAIHQADVNGISLALDQAITYLPELPFKSVKDEIKVQFTEEKANVIEDDTFVGSVLEAVKQIGDIKIHQRSIKAASSADQQNSIEQLLRTYLLGARLAALRFDQVQFLHEINQAGEIVRLHYDESDNRIQQLQKTLLDYSALQLSPDLPELTKAWAMLQKEMKGPSSKTENSVAIEAQSKKTQAVSSDIKSEKNNQGAE